MAVRTIECSACGSAVPYGRLSCPECGELLASVAGAARRLTSVAAIGESARAMAASTIQTIVAKPAEPEPTKAVQAEQEPTQPEPESEPAESEAAESEPAEPEPAEPESEPSPAHVLAHARPVPSVLHEAVAEPAVAEPDIALDGADDDERDDAEPVAWSSPPAPGPFAVALPTPSAAIPTPSAAIPTPSASASRVADLPPGAYVPPAPAPLQPTAAQPAGLPAPARAWGGIGGGTAAAPGTTAPAGGGPAREALSLTDPTRRAEAIGWLAVAGSTIGAAGFLLPWARTIIGADGVGYLDTWGFAGPGHPLVVIGLLGVLALAVVKNPIPAWARLGIPGIAFGSLLIGLLWPYVMGPLGPLPGAYLSLVGAAVLVVAAIACLATERHAPTLSGV